jgi:hypothetical protein
LEFGVNKKEAIRDALLVLASAFIGYAGFTTAPLLAALVLAVPVLWTLAKSRRTAFAVMLAYKLAASRGLLPGAAVFLSEDHSFWQAAVLYLLLPLGVSLPFLVFWDSEPKLKAMAVVPAFLIAYLLPPLSLIGIINPIIASGAVFRGWGFAGMITVLAVYVSCAASRKAAYSILCVIAAFTVLAPNSWYEPPTPEGIISVDTSFGRLGSGSFSFERDYDRANMVFGDLKNRDISRPAAKIVALPETIAGRLNRAGLELWRDEIRRLLPDKTVIFGAELPTSDGRKYDNAVLMVREGEIVCTRQKIPVPYSMYKGPFAKTGANLHLWDSGILPLPESKKAAAIVCYEAFLTWPFVASMIHKPDVVVCVANLWWCRDTSLPATQKTIVSLWSLLFGVPAVFAWNI